MAASTTSRGCNLLTTTNTETAKAIEQTLAGLNLHTAEIVDELFEDLRV
jgi:hypothetical protein